MFKYFLLFSILSAGFLVFGQDPYVVMLSMDGFRWDYPDKVATPNLDYIAKNGVKAASLKPCYPTKTFPNHYSIATGLYPDHHGIVNNEFYDPQMDRTYQIRDREAVEDPVFYGGEPIWVTAEMQKVISASYFWVGSEAPILGIRPTYWKRYQSSTPFVNRIDTVIYWLSLPEEKRPHLITFYFDEPDGIGHDYGPDSPQMDSTVHALDSLVGILLDKLKALPHYNEINLIITSDHGMGEISEDRVIFLNDHLKAGWIEMYQGGNPNYNLMAAEGYLDSSYIALKSLEHLKVWKSEKVPDYLHYGQNPRCMDLVVVADSSWSVRWDRRGRYDYGGTHGYDPENKDMHAIFYAIGPAFKQNYTHPTLSNLDIYPLIARILGIKPAPVDGQLKNTIKMLR
jgi:alkaline phosphatase D